MALLATRVGANRARNPVDARTVARETVALALERGSDDPEVLSRVSELRRALGRRALDSRTRVAYASLLVALARQVEDARSAGFHAHHAARLAPVTVPVVRSAALVLVRTGHAEESFELTKRMFDYDQAAAARLLVRLEQVLFGGDLADGLPDDPAAWLAFARELRMSGRIDDADRWAERAFERWPGDLPALEQVAALAIRQRDWDRLDHLFSEERELPDGPQAAGVLLYHARLLARRGDDEGALEEIERALRLNGSARRVQILAGQTYDAMGELDDARRQWNRALFGLPPGEKRTRRTLLFYLAQLEERRHQPAAALRLWESLLEIDPEHREARQRVNDLSSGIVR